VSTEGVDYFNTNTHDNELCFVNNGKSFVCRYYDNSGGTSLKILDAAEANSLHSAGLIINTVYETCGGSPCCGCPPGVSYFTPGQGTYDGQQALGAAQRAGQPGWAPIYFAVDYDASDADLGVIVEYFNSVYNAINGAYPLGIYGSFRSVEYAQAHWPGVPYKWQTYAWSGGQLSAYAHIWQFLNSQFLCNTNVDMDRQFSGSGW
jgi:hypothetical protein